MLSAPAFAAEHQNPAYTLFPPADCSAQEPRAIVWRDTDSATRCITGQDLLKLALPGCKAGQQVVFDGSAFVCKDPATKDSK